MTDNHNAKPDYNEILGNTDYLGKLNKQLGEQTRAALAGRSPSNAQLLQNDEDTALAIAYLSGQIEALFELVLKLQGGAS